MNILVVSLKICQISCMWTCRSILCSTPAHLFPGWLTKMENHKGPVPSGLGLGLVNGKSWQEMEGGKGWGQGLCFSSSHLWRSSQFDPVLGQKVVPLRQKNYPSRPLVANSLAAACPSCLHDHLIFSYVLTIPSKLGPLYIILNCLNLTVPFVSCWSPHNTEWVHSFKKFFKGAQEQKVWRPLMQTIESSIHSVDTGCIVPRACS